MVEVIDGILCVFSIIVATYSATSWIGSMLACARAIARVNFLPTTKWF